jgi:hypothetical protein
MTPFRHIFEAMLEGIMTTASSSFVMAGVMGWPIKHSRSPLIHSHWIAEHGLQGVYLPLPVNPLRLPEALAGLSALGFAGCNLTLPHKVQALECLSDMDDVARQIGAVNTVVVQPDGRLRGTNTDAFGYVQSLREAQPAWQASAGPAVVLGAGVQHARWCGPWPMPVPQTFVCSTAVWTKRRPWPLNLAHPCKRWRGSNAMPPWPMQRCS